MVRIVDGKAVVATADLFTLWSTIPTTGPVAATDTLADVDALGGGRVVAVR